MDLIAGCSSIICASGTLAVALKKWAKGCPDVWGKACLIAWSSAGSAAIVVSPNSTLTVVPCKRWNRKKDSERKIWFTTYEKEWKILKQKFSMGTEFMYKIAINEYLDLKLCHLIIRSYITILHMINAIIHVFFPYTIPHWHSKIKRWY